MNMARVKVYFGLVLYILWHSAIAAASPSSSLLLTSLCGCRRHRRHHLRGCRYRFAFGVVVVSGAFAFGSCVPQLVLYTTTSNIILYVRVCLCLRVCTIYFIKFVYKLSMFRWRLCYEQQQHQQQQ